MQIQLSHHSPEKNPDPAKKHSHQHLTLAFSFFPNPAIRPALFQQHLHSLLALSLPLYPFGPFSLLSLPMSRYIMFLFPLLIPNLHPIQAGGFQRGADVRKDKLRGPRKHCVLFESFCLRGDFSSRKKAELDWRALELGGVRRLGRCHVDWCSGNLKEALNLRRNLLLFHRQAGELCFISFFVAHFLFWPPEKEIKSPA